MSDIDKKELKRATIARKNRIKARLAKIGDCTGLNKTKLKKQDLLNNVLNNSGNLTKALKDTGINAIQLRSYLTDGNFKEKLSAIQSELAGELFQVGYLKAINGDNRMIEFILPALDSQFDAGVRKQQAATTGLMQSELFKRLLQAPGSDVYIESTNTGINAVGSSEGELSTDNGHLAPLPVPTMGKAGSTTDN